MQWQSDRYPLLMQQLKQDDLARLSPATFAMAASNGLWELVPHLALINRYLLDLCARQYHGLIIVLPPRHGKSEFISKYFTAWFLGSFPGSKVILASYEADFATSWGAKARDVYRLMAPRLWNADVVDYPARASDWATTQGGGMMTRGVGGALTGVGAQLLALDDTVKNAEEAASATYRNKAWEWFRSTAFTRLEPDGICCIVNTRWHEDDLAGRLLREYPDDWVLLRLPAIAEDEDPLGRQPGAPLWPGRFGLDALAQIREQIGPQWFSALYQGLPTSLEGGLCPSSWWKYSDGSMGIVKRKIIAIDTAYKTGTMNDYTVLATWVLTSDNQFHCVDLLRQRVEFPDLLNAVKVMYAKHDGAMVLVEDAASGQSLIQVLRRDTAIPIHAVPVVTDKVTRFSKVTGYIEGGRCFLPSGAPWTYDFVEEHRQFPNGAHDDMVDCTSMALGYLSRQLPGSTNKIITEHKRSLWRM